MEEVGGGSSFLPFGSKRDCFALSVTMLDGASKRDEEGINR